MDVLPSLNLEIFTTKDSFIVEIIEVKFILFLLSSRLISGKGWTTLLHTRRSQKRRRGLRGLLTNRNGRETIKGAHKSPPLRILGHTIWILPDSWDFECTRKNAIAKSTYSCKAIHPFGNGVAGQLKTDVLAEVIAILGD
jgi:hypothetical protein